MSTGMAAIFGSMRERDTAMGGLHFGKLKPVEAICIVGLFTHALDKKFITCISATVLAFPSHLATGYELLLYRTHGAGMVGHKFCVSCM
jgi:hypothetical protein